MINYNFSIITPTFKTPLFKLERLFNSLKEQTYSNWEWVVLDDSPKEYMEVYSFIESLNDDRIKLYKNDLNSGIIGLVKNKAFNLANGDILVEVDHDDELINTCLENLLVAYNYSDEIGFVYGHTCELYEDGSGIIDYGNNWGLGYGSYKQSIYRNNIYKVAIAPNINPKTIRHITGVPNHVRTWRKSVYQEIGGHNKKLHVADDFDIIIRTFLKTKMAKIDVFTYKQYFEKNKSNTQYSRNKDIHVLVPQITRLFNNDIYERFLELNINDYVWNNDIIDLNTSKPEIEQYANVIIPSELLKTNLIEIDIKLKKEFKDKLNKYGYSRVYNIESTLEYKQTEHYSNFIKWLVRLTNCRSYLELGVEYGTNILEIKDLVENCVGVDINVVDIIDKNNIIFHQMTTDMFFSENNQTFDIIFIDANHEYEQVKKDFENSLACLNKLGIIIIHDTDPIVKELINECHCHDSYKIVDYIQERSDLNIVTLPIQETGLTLVMRKEDRRVLNFIKN